MGFGSVFWGVSFIEVIQKKCLEQERKKYQNGIVFADF